MPGPAVLLEGSARPSEIDRFVARYADRLRACIEAAGGTDTEPFGRLTARWHVDGDGLASDVGIERSSWGTPSVVRCLEQEIGRMRFLPPTDGPLEVALPIDAFRVVEPAPEP